MESQDTRGATSVQLGGVTIRFVHSHAADPYSLIEWMAPPGEPAPPVHLHRRTAEGFYVLSGTFAFLLAGQTLELSSGSHVLVPPKQRHTFWNAGDENASCLILLSPPGFELYFRELAEQLGADQSEEAALRVRRELSARHDIEVVGPAPA